MPAVEALGANKRLEGLEVGDGSKMGDDNMSWNNRWIASPHREICTLDQTNSYQIHSGRGGEPGNETPHRRSRDSSKLSKPTLLAHEHPS